MFRNRRLVKVIAMFLLVNLLQWTFFDTVAYALTSGPTAPEYTSFEPVDTTDMVNLQSGDFTYNIPLLNVPSPEGGYPISLSYHDGIQPNEEASWVGLGWTLNPGAINRIVNNYPDDNKGEVRTIRDYWGGGTTTSWSIGLDVGPKVGGVGLSAGVGLEISNDTYKGFGVGAKASAGVGKMYGDFKVGANVEVGVSPYGKAYGSAGVGAYHMNTGIGLGVGITTNFETVGGYASLAFKPGLFPASRLGASISSNGLNPSWSVANVRSSNDRNNRAGSITTESGGGNMPIPTPVPGLFVTIGHNYMRYYSLTKDDVSTYGTLYLKDVPVGKDITIDPYHGTTIVDDETKSSSSSSMDSYSMEPSNVEEFVDNSNGDAHVSGSFPAYDYYNVVAQGISGTMQPYIFENGSITRKLEQKDTDDDGSYDYSSLAFRRLSAFQKEVGFRFNNDFSNNLINNLSNLYRSGHEYDLDDNGIKYRELGYLDEKQHLEGSRHIDWYTCEEMDSENLDGVIKPAGYTYDILNDITDFSKKIGGFVITNETGVTYHFTQPVYAYDNSSNSQFYDDAGSVVQHTYFNPERYAYTWLLTAITGPDYVDRNNDNLVDDGDWGYWIGFEYGRWLTDFTWRNPAQGYKVDIDGKTQNSAAGKKEIYYLDAIRTRTHTAIFEKSIRNDGKTILYASAEDDNSKNSIPYEEVTQCDGDDFTYSATPKKFIYPQSLLKLDNIYLINNNDLPDGIDAIKTKSTSHNFTVSNVIVQCDGGSETKIRNVLTYDNVIDGYDINSLNTSDNFNNKVIRKISFNHDYSLCPGTINSIDNAKTYIDEPDPSNIDFLGKLTLNSLDFKTYADKSIMPSMEFGYDLESPKSGTASITHLIGSGLPEHTEKNRMIRMHFGGGHQLLPGDIISFSQSGTTYYGTLMYGYDWGGTPNAIFDVRFLNEIPQSLGSISYTQTKNPPYNRKAYDIWNMYKSDYMDSEKDENIDRLVSSISAKSTDVWSLRKVTGFLGDEMYVDYESDDYGSEAAKMGENIDIESAEKDGSYVKVTFPSHVNPYELFSQGNNVDLTLYLYKRTSKEHFIDTDIGEIKAVGNDYLLINSQKMFDMLNPDRELIVGVVGVEDFVRKYGGGSRVSRITTHNLGSVYEISYDYDEGNRSSGVTSFTPNFDVKLDYLNVENFIEPWEPVSSQLATRANFIRNMKEFYKKIYVKYSGFLGMSRHLPSPGVTYRYVTIEETGNGQKKYGKQRYRFQVFEKNMVTKQSYIGEDGYFDSEKYNIGDSEYEHHYIWNSWVIKDKTAGIGNVLSVETLDDNGNLIEKVENTYSSNEIAIRENYGNQGVIQQEFNEYRIRKFSDDNFSQHLGVLSRKEEYPSVLTKTKHYKDGIETTTNYLAYDFYSGQATKVAVDNGQGIKLETVTIPAYRKYPGMGLKINNPNNKHMLTQSAGSFVTDWGQGGYDYAGNYRIYDAGNDLYYFEINEDLNGVSDAIKTIDLTDGGATWRLSVEEVIRRNGKTRIYFESNHRFRSSYVGFHVNPVLSASVQTWNNEWKYRLYDDDLGSWEEDLPVEEDRVWRKHANYTYDSKPNKEGYLSNVQPFSWNKVFPSNTKWKKVNEITRYDRFSHVLEDKDVNGRYHSAKYDEFGEHTIAVSTNSTFDSYFHSSFEVPANYTQHNKVFYTGQLDQDNGMLKLGDATITPHTGHYCLEVESNKSGAQFIHEFRDDGSGSDIQASNGMEKGRKYRVSVWVHKDSPDNAGIEILKDYEYGTVSMVTKVDASAIQVGDWILIQQDFEIPEVYIGGTGHWPALKIKLYGGAGTAYFDDFRLRPIDASTNGYVYDYHTGLLTHILNNENFYTRYEYDDAGKLVAIYKEDPIQAAEVRVSDFYYNYKK